MIRQTAGKEGTAFIAVTFYPFILNLLGGEHVLLFNLIALIAMDFPMGVLSAWAMRKKGVPWFDWDKAVRGAVKKIAYIFAIASAHLMDCGSVYMLGADTGDKLRLMFLIMFNMVEFNSILRHLGACNLPIPAFVKQYVCRIMKAMTDKEECNRETSRTDIPDDPESSPGASGEPENQPATS